MVVPPPRDRYKKKMLKDHPNQTIEKQVQVEFVFDSNEMSFLLE
jgi:hypothetical protein